MIVSSRLETHSLSSEMLPFLGACFLDLQIRVLLEGVWHGK